MQTATTTKLFGRLRALTFVSSVNKTLASSNFLSAEQGAAGKSEDCDGEHLKRCTLC